MIALPLTVAGLIALCVVISPVVTAVSVAVSLGSAAHTLAADYANYKKRHAHPKMFHVKHSQKVPEYHFNSQ